MGASQHVYLQIFCFESNIQLKKKKNCLWANFIPHTVLGAETGELRNTWLSIYRSLYKTFGIIWIWTGFKAIYTPPLSETPWLADASLKNGTQKMGINTDQCISALWYLCKEAENFCSHKNFYLSVHSNFIHKVPQSSPITMSPVNCHPGALCSSLPRKNVRVQTM